MRRSLFALPLALLLIQPATAQMPKQLTADDIIVAVINGETVTERDIRMMLPDYNIDLNTLAPQQKAEIMREVITQRTLAAAGRKEKVDQTVNFAARKRALVDSAIARMMIDRFMTTAAKVDEKELRALYEKNKQSYINQKIRASHILVKSKKEAEAILADIKAGKKFADLAKAKSIGPSGARGGDLGEFGRGQMVPAFEKAAFALEKGAVGGPVKTQFGYHIIKVTEKGDAKPIPFEQVADKLRQTIVNDRLTAYLKEVRKKTTVEIKDPRFAISGE
ncbi:MAG: hypothetical protein CMM48_13000 [Rhodospirillaceae bacterium]|nr:hypothetical protein [Rhodospirillaceae bacterium]